MKLPTRGTGFAVLLVLTVASITGGTVFSEISSTSKIQNSHASNKSSDGANSESMNYSDCLWYVARNYGFYQVQRKVAMNESDSRNRKLWEQFVHTTGADECGPVQFDLAELVEAVTMTVAEADQYFLSQHNL